METIFSVWNTYGGLYKGTDEAMADAAYEKGCEYIDNDVCHEPMKVVFEVDGVAIAQHESITYHGYYVMGQG